MQDMHPCVSFCPKQFHPPALTPGFVTLEYIHSIQNTPCLLPQPPSISVTEISWQGCPFLIPHAQHSPPALQSAHWVCCSAWCLTERPLGATSGGNMEPGSTRAGRGGSPQQGSSFPEVPTSLQLKCQQWAKSFQWTVKQHLHTTKLLPCFQIKSLHLFTEETAYLSMKVNWSGNSSWYFQICQYASMSANMLGKNKQYWQFLHAKIWHTKRKAAAKKTLNRHYKKDNKIEMCQA